jgi:hypothetical protein
MSKLILETAQSLGSRSEIRELEMLTKVEQERMRYEPRMLAIRTQQALIEVDERRIETGQYIGRIHRCEQLLNRPRTPSDDSLSLPSKSLAAVPTNWKRN